MRLHNCYLGLGSNLNNPAKQLNKAIEHLSALPNTTIISSATWYVSKAWGVTDQNDFINTAIHIKTPLSPLALLKAIKIIEYRLMQRPANPKWHARNIDIDILLYEKRQYHRPQLIIPHPLIAQRCFVAAPLLQLAPEMPSNLKKQLQQHLNSHRCTDSLSKATAIKTTQLRVKKR